MRVRSFARAALAAAVSSLAVVALPAHAQPLEGARLPADLVVELVATPDAPGARTRLARHFLAVAADYDAQAREHTAMAKSYRRTPTASESKRPNAPDTAVHCDRLAARAADAATEARALAAAYGGDAPAVQVPSPGITNTAPAKPNSTELLGATELRQLVEGVQTPGVHARLERHYLALAAKLDGDARAHRDLAAAYRAAPGASETKRPGAPDTAVHCERLAERVSGMAEDARVLARRHAQQRGGR